MSTGRKYALSIAGFDPSQGAGIGADLKTFEQLGVYGLGVCTAITVQDEEQVKSVSWTDLSTITDQIEVLLDRYPVEYAKIGLIENFDVLEEVLFFLKEKNPNLRIIWDPILKSGGGFVFHEEVYTKQLKNLLKDIYLLTPNRQEVTRLSPADAPEKSARALSAYTSVYLKDGHNKEAACKDILYTARQEFEFTADRLPHAKHGSGCVFSAALVAALANGRELTDACSQAKDYVTRYIGSDESLLGWHQPQAITEGA